MQIHDFDSSLVKSREVEDMPFWEECYRQAFPELTYIQSCKTDGVQQRSGIDRVIILSTGKQYTVDEKVRFKSFDDIALEFELKYNNGNTVRGWVCKPLMCDFIAYAIAPLGKCYMLPVAQLQQAWNKHSKEWLNTYPIIESKNRSHITRSVCLKPRDLFKAIGECLRVYFNPVEL